jgi:hypothetical protein
VAREIGKAASLKRLHIDRTAITDAGLKDIAKLKLLTSLSLDSNPKITDKGIHELTALTELQNLQVAGTPITDKSVPSFAKMKKLKSLFIVDTRITPKGVAELGKLLPGCNIKR